MSQSSSRERRSACHLFIIFDNTENKIPRYFATSSNTGKLGHVFSRLWVKSSFSWHETEFQELTVFGNSTLTRFFSQRESVFHWKVKQCQIITTTRKLRLESPRFWTLLVGDRPIGLNWVETQKTPGNSVGFDEVPGGYLIWLNWVTWDTCRSLWISQMSYTNP